MTNQPSNPYLTLTLGNVSEDIFLTELDAYEDKAGALFALFQKVLGRCRNNPGQWYPGIEEAQLRAWEEEFRKRSWFAAQSPKTPGMPLR